MLSGPDGPAFSKKYFIQLVLKNYGMMLHDHAYFVFHVNITMEIAYRASNLVDWYKYKQMNIQVTGRLKCFTSEN
jgi:hypothetical protein